jgi:ABC-2 type transport system permease protein
MNTRWPLLPAGTPRAAFGMIVLNEARLGRRQQPLGLVAGVVLPTVLLVIIGSIPSNHKHLKILGGLTYFDVYVPVFLALVITALALFGLPIPLASYRQQGILRRLSTTPAPPAWVLAAQLILNLCFVAMELALLLAVAVAGFGAAAPKSPGGLVLALAASSAALFAIGLWISAVARTEQAAGLLAVACLIPMMFFAGLWFPRAEMPKPLLGVSNFTPVGAAVQAIQSALLDGFPPIAPLLVLSAYAVIFGALAVRFFRWE